MTARVAHAKASRERLASSGLASGARHARIVAMRVDQRDVLALKDVPTRTVGKMRLVWVTPHFALNVMRWNMPKWLSIRWQCRPTERH